MAQSGVRAKRISPATRVEGELRMPGDKSISHRALLVGMIAEGPITVTGLSTAMDVRSTRRGVELLGARIVGGEDRAVDNPQVDIENRQVSRGKGDFQIQVTGPGWDALATPPMPIDVGNSGTTIRLLLGVLAGSRTDVTLTGDDSIRRRPMGRVVEPLRLMGADIQGRDGGALAPLTVHGRPLHGASLDLPVASAQVKSALLFAGLRASGETAIAAPGSTRDHTERMLRHLGVSIDEDMDRLIVKSTNIQGGSLTIPGDLSSAAFFLVAASILPGSTITVPDVGLNRTRTGIIDILRAFGARVTLTDLREESGEPVGTVTVGAADRRPLTVAGDLTVRSIDELPLVALLGAMADGTTVVADAQELRVKESDRIAAIEVAMKNMGVDIHATPDGFIVKGSSGLRGAVVDAAHDHRIAMTLAVAALAADGATTIQSFDAAEVSHPGFEHDLASVVVP